MSLTVSGYAMIPFDEVCQLLSDPARAAVLISDAVRQVSTTARISVPHAAEVSSAHSAHCTVEWYDTADARHDVSVRLYAVQGGLDPISEIVATIDDVLEPARRAVVARGLHRILDLFTAEVEHPAARAR